MLELLQGPWHWSVAGVIIGLTVPALLLISNRSFGISSSLRHICAACMPANIDFFKYDWKKETWNLMFVFGIFLGGIIAATLLHNPEPMIVHPELTADLVQYGIDTTKTDLVPTELFSWDSLLTLRGFLFMVVGGFFVGFGTRYAGGCTSGHSIMGLANLQWPSLVATICFMVGGFITANFIVPILLAL